MKPSLRSFLKVCLLVVGFMAASPTKAQWVTIPDANFVAFLQQRYPTCMNGSLMDTSCGDIVNELYLDCSTRIIYDVEGVQYFKNLEVLDCSANRLISLPLLPNSLQILRCAVNEIVNLPQLPTSLRELECSNNLLISLPSLPASLESLWCEFNGLASLPNLPGSLWDLNCYHNSLQVLPTLPNSLIMLQCGANQLVNLPSLPNFLDHLNCQSNELTSLPTLPARLTEIYCHGNQLTSLPDLPDSLTAFVVGGNPDLKCIPPFKKFWGNDYYFDISNTAIQCLPNIPHVGYIAAIDTMPSCSLFNLNGCAVAWNIEGSIYRDGNANCVQETNEATLSPIKMNLFSAGNVLQSGYFSHNYSFDTDLSTYTVAVDTTGLPFLFACPGSGETTLTLTSQDSLKYGIDFGLKCKTGFDLGVKSIAGNLFRPAASTLVTIHAGDMAKAHGVNCASGIGGSVIISFTGPASYVSPASGALTPNNVNGNTLTYNIANFGTVDFNNAFNIIVRTDTFAQAGQQICFTVSVTPTAGDNNPTNNVLTQCFTVRASYDPNNKEVSPAGRIDSSQGWLTYTVNFQNTGTDTAIHIYIDDTLDTNLDMASFQLLAYSHANVTQVLPGGVVKFNFPNIYLPDSNINEPLSHGYAQYKVKVKDGLTTGSGIRNKAYIYFDFNPPVETNEVFNLFCIPDTTNLVEYICAGGEGYLFNDTLRTNTGFYSATYTLGNGCDSVVNLSLTLHPGIPVTQIRDTICEGDFYSFNDTLLQMPGNYTIAFQTAEGCDSVVELSLALRPSVTLASALTVCYGGSMMFNDTVRTASGIYSVVYQAANGCDSIHQLNLTVRPEAIYHFYITICQGESYRFKDQDLNTTGIYIDTLRISTCDSFNILHLTVDTNELTIQQVAGDTLMATGLGSIRWIDCNSGLLVPDETDSVFTTTTFGSFAAIFSYSNCVDTTECRTVGFTGLPKYENPEVVLFPNPARDQLMVQAYHFFPERLSIYDVNGRKVLEDSFHQPVSIHLLQPGCYYLEVKDSQVTVRKRFVKM